MTNIPLPEPAAEDHARARFFTTSMSQPSNDEQGDTIRKLNNLVVKLAVTIEELTPASRNQSLALTALEDVSMRANRAIFAVGRPGACAPRRGTGSVASSWKRCVCPPNSMSATTASARTTRRARPSPGWMLGHGFRIDGDRRPFGLATETPEGVMRAEAGDWIVRGVQSEFYRASPTSSDVRGCLRPR